MAATKASIDLSGMGVALVTPFLPDKSIDFDALDRLIDYQIESGTDYLVVLGTTSENTTLSADERTRLRHHIVKRTSGRLPLVLGCGGNNTAEVVKALTSSAEELKPFSAILSVVPYYNKP